MKNLLLLVVTASVLLVSCGDSTEPIFTTTPIGTAVTTSTPTPTPSLTPSLTPSQTPTPTLIPTPTPPPTRQRTEKTELQFKEDDQAVIHVYYDDCTGVTESFRNGDVVTVFGRSKDKEDELYVGKKVIIVITGIETYKYVYGFVRTSCLEWSGNIEDWADVIFPTPIPTPSPLPTPTPISTGTTRR